MTTDTIYETQKQPHDLPKETKPNESENPTFETAALESFDRLLLPRQNASFVDLVISISIGTRPGNKRESHE